MHCPGAEHLSKKSNQIYQLTTGRNTTRDLIEGGGGKKTVSTMLFPGPFYQSLGA